MLSVGPQRRQFLSWVLMLRSSFQAVVTALFSAVQGLRRRYCECVRQRYAVRPLRETQPLLNDWWQSDKGLSQLLSERRALNHCLAGLHGSYMMALGVQELPVPDTCRVQNSFSLSPSEHCSVSAQASLEQLPLPESVVDVAVLQHTLEYSVDPHQLLREVDRVLTPHGHLVVVVFNPLSCAGLCSSIMRLIAPKAHRCHHLLRAGRVRDWLRLLDFETQSIPSLEYHSWQPQSVIMQALKRIAVLADNFGLPLSSYCVIVAQKRVAPLTPSKPLWLPLAPVSRFAAAPFVGSRISRVNAAKNTLGNGQ